MSTFRDPADTGGTSAGTRSYLGPGCVFEGEIRGRGSLECHGTITGTVTLEGEIYIGERGNVRAQLSAGRIVIEGHLEGDAIGSERVEVAATGKVTGDIRAPSVSFAEGAVFEGNVEMRSTRAAQEKTNG